MITASKMLALLGIAAAAVVGRAAAGEVIFTTMPTGTFHPAFNSTVTADFPLQEIAVQFTVTRTRTLTSVTLGLSSDAATPVRGRIAVADGIAAGVTVADLNIPSVQAVSAYVATPSTPTVLQPGTYYVHLSGVSPGRVRWHTSDQPISVAHSFRTIYGWIASDLTFPPAVQVDGGASAGCCNPTTGACTVVDIATCETLELSVLAGACSPTSCRFCPADYNRSGELSVQDVFDFLASYFGGCF